MKKLFLLLSCCVFGSLNAADGKKEAAAKTSEASLKTGPQQKSAAVTTTTNASAAAKAAANSSSTAQQPSLQEVSLYITRYAWHERSPTPSSPLIRKYYPTFDESLCESLKTTTPVNSLHDVIAKSVYGHLSDAPPKGTKFLLFHNSCIVSNIHNGLELTEKGFATLGDLLPKLLKESNKDGTSFRLTAIPPYPAK